MEEKRCRFRLYWNGNEEEKAEGEMIMAKSKPRLGSKNGGTIFYSDNSTKRVFIPSSANVLASLNKEFGKQKKRSR